MEVFSMRILSTETLREIIINLSESCMTKRHKDYLPALAFLVVSELEVCENNSRKSEQSFLMSKLKPLALMFMNPQFTNLSSETIH